MMSYDNHNKKRMGQFAGVIFFLISICVYASGQIVDVFYSCGGNITDTITNSCSIMDAKAECTGVDTASVYIYPDCELSNDSNDPSVSSWDLTAGTCVKAEYLYSGTVYLRLRPGTCKSLSAQAIVGIVFAAVVVTCICIIFAIVMAYCCGFSICSCCKNRSNVVI